MASYGQFTARMKLWQHNGHITPAVEVSEGIRPEHFFPAPYLPVIRYDVEHETWFSLTEGQIVTLDGDGHLVPAGMSSVTYTENDIGEAYNIATGVLVTASDLTENNNTTVTYDFCGERGVEYMSVSPFHVGIMPYNAFAAYFGVIATELDSGYFSFECDPNRPNKEKYTNFNPQATTAILCDREIQVPYIGASEDGFSTRALTYVHAYGDIATMDDFTCEDGIMTAAGYFYPGCLVCHDTNGMYVPFNAGTHGYGDVVGQLMKIDSRYPRNYLERVKTSDGGGQFGTEDQLPGSATRGMDYAIHIATDGAYRAAVDAGNDIEAYMHTMFRINLILR